MILKEFGMESCSFSSKLKCMSEQNCPNCGASLDGPTAKCPRCGERTEPWQRVWRRYFLISFLATPALCIGLPLWRSVLQKSFPLSQLAKIVTMTRGAELLILVIGTAVSAYSLVRSQGKSPHSSEVAAYAILLLFLYIVISLLGYAQIARWLG